MLISSSALPRGAQDYGSGDKAHGIREVAGELAF
jgi:hypothetical protein